MTPSTDLPFLKCLVLSSPYYLPRLYRLNVLFSVVLTILVSETLRFTEKSKFPFLYLKKILKVPCLNSDYSPSLTELYSFFYCNDAKQFLMTYSVHICSETN